MRMKTEVELNWSFDKRIFWTSRRSASLSFELPLCNKEGGKVKVSINDICVDSIDKIESSTSFKPPPEDWRMLGIR